MDSGVLVRRYFAIAQYALKAQDVSHPSRPQKEPFELNTSLLIKLAFVESVRYDGMAFGSGCVVGCNKEVAMAGKFSYLKFKDIDLSDPFFDSLKEDYRGFDGWFKSKSDEPVFVYRDDLGVAAFLYLKDKEAEVIETVEGKLPLCERTKIGTLKLAERIRGQRIGEGALGLALWQWRKLKTQEIYLTVFPTHKDVISLIKRFGFSKVGEKVGANGKTEHVYLKSRNHLDYSSPYTSFPFVNPRFETSGYIIIEDKYHDKLFPYSELKGIDHKKDMVSKACSFAGNGITKFYVGSPASPWPYKPGDPIFVYRKSSLEQKRYRSCVTSLAVVTEITIIKASGNQYKTEDEFLDYIGNKSIFTEDELKKSYRQKRTVVVLGMVYCAFFGAGNNVNMDWLDKNGCWTVSGEYPATKRLNHSQFNQILSAGGFDVSDVIVD